MLSQRTDHFWKVCKEGPVGGRGDTKDSIDGQVAERLDQRGVKISFQYGQDAASPPASLITAVDVDIPGDGSVDDFVNELTFSYNQRSQLTAASARGDDTLRSGVTFTYDDTGKLTSETLDPTGDGTYAKDISYTWRWIEHISGDPPGRHRLESMTYPSGRTFDFDYGTAPGIDDRLNRATGLSHDGQEVIAYDYTGGGRSVVKTWGEDVVMLDYRSGGLDRYGRVKDMNFTVEGGNVPVTIQRFLYGYDLNGNRTFARVTQAGHDNDRSFLYQYDHLNRLINAEYGELKPTALYRLKTLLAW